jgi:DNA-directed RNA polymerase specialized sigma24 family protein
MLEQVKYSAARVARRYRMSIADDLYQEGIVWVYAHARTVEGWMNDEYPKRGWARFTRRIESVMQKIARAEKASREGYDPDDEAFYYTAMIELVLPALWDSTFRIDGPQRDGSERSSGHDASEGNTWAAMVLDVERAWHEAHLSTRDQSMLRMRYGSQALFSEVARVFECSTSTAEATIKKALRRMQNVLGGAKPQECDATCEDCGGPGSRRALSNTTARAITDKEYE